MLVEYTGTITTDGSGDATVYVGQSIRGRVVAVKYAPGTIDTGATLTLEGATTGVAILTKANAGTATVWYYPRAIPNKVTDGSAFTDASTEVWLYKERMKVTVASGGTTKTGTITLYAEEPQAA